MATGQRERVAVGARGPRAAESALGPRALGKFPWSKVPTHNLAHDSSHDPAHDPAKGGWAVWRSHDLSRDRQDNPYV